MCPHCGEALVARRGVQNQEELVGKHQRGAAERVAKLLAKR